jgi:tetratricopeptide (TPR) repeat protein
MDVRLKSISAAGVPAALAKAEQYRLLNEPGEAESICRDVLAIEPDNQMAIRLLGLTLTDQFNGTGLDRYAEASRVFDSLRDPYERLYYGGILHERRAKAQLRGGCFPHTLFVLFEEAMHCFERAEKLRPSGNDDAILRWNRCVRILQSRTSSEWAKEFDPIETSDSPPDWRP